MSEAHAAAGDAGPSYLSAESGKGISCLIVSSKDMMKLKIIKIFLQLPYLLLVCCHVGVTTV